MSVFCVECGLKIEDSFKFCPSCGTPVVSVSDKRPENTEQEIVKPELKEQERNIKTSDGWSEYAVNKDGEEVFYIYVTIGKGEAAKKGKVEYAKGNGAKLCKNGLEAIGILEKEGCRIKSSDMATTLGFEFDLADENCVVLKPEIIANLFEVHEFFKTLGLVLKWNELSEMFGLDLSEFSKLEVVDILSSVMQKKLDMSLPVESENKMNDESASSGVSSGSITLREGESLLLHMNYDGALVWFLNAKEYSEVEKGYIYNVIGQLYLTRSKNSENAQPQDYEEAKKWLEKSVDCDYLLGELNLGNIYWSGISNDCDLKKAFKCYYKAYKHGNDRAIDKFYDFMMRNLVDLYEGGCRVDNDFDFSELADKCEKEAENEMDWAVLAYGYIYQHGLGRNQSLTKAIEYYESMFAPSGRRRSRHRNIYTDHALELLGAIRSEHKEMISYDEGMLQVLKRAASLEQALVDATEEENIEKEEKFGETAPKKPEYMGCFVIDGSVKYDENICFSEAELNLELQLYNVTSTFYNESKDNWTRNHNLKLEQIERRKADVMEKKERIQTNLDSLLPPRDQNAELMSYCCEYMESCGANLEEALWAYTFIHCLTEKAKIDGRNVTLSQGDAFCVVKPITEVVSEILEKEKQIKELRDEDARLKKGDFGKVKPVKPACKPALNADAPSNHYKGVICDTNELYVAQIDLFLKDLKRYYLEKNRLLDERPKKRKELKLDIDSIQAVASSLYGALGIRSKYRNLSAMEYVYKYLSTTDGTLESAFDEYDKKVEVDKKNAEEEKERQRLIKLEQDRIRQEESRRRFEQLNREYEEQEAEYARRQEERYYDHESRGSGGGSFLRDVASAAIGGSIANHGVKKELRKQTQELERQRKDNERRLREEETREKIREFREISDARYERNEILRQNRERRRKGLPPLPVPPERHF